MEEQLERFDFTGPRPNRKHILDSCGTIEYYSYTLRFRTLGDQIMQSVCAAASLPRAPFLELRRSKADPQNIVGIPRSESDASTVAVHWTEKGETAHIDLAPLFSVQPFHIPHGSRAYIPVERAELRTLGPCILFRFGKAKFKPIESRDQSGRSPAQAEAAASVET